MNEFIVVAVFILILLISAVFTMVVGFLVDGSDSVYVSWFASLLLLTGTIVYCLIDKGFLHWG